MNLRKSPKKIKSNSYRLQDWYLFEPYSSEPEMIRATIWEYARECRPLREEIESLRGLVKNVLQIDAASEIAQATYSFVSGEDPMFISETILRISDKGEQFLEKLTLHKKTIDRICPRLNWTFLCSHEFPTKSWMLADVKCEIKNKGKILRGAADAFLEAEKKQEEPKTGKKKGKKKQVRIEPPSFVSGVSFSTYDFDDYFQCGGMEVLDAIREDLSSTLMEANRKNYGKAHIVMITDEALNISDPEVISSYIRKKIYHLSGRRLISNDPIIQQKRRSAPSHYLKWLGVYRYSKLPRVDRERFFNQLTHSIPNAGAVEALKYIDCDYSSEFCRKAERIYEGIFDADSPPKALKKRS